jgi:hypothetical protein
MKKIALILALCLALPAAAGGPMYKPSSKSKAPLDISTNEYGAFRFTPDAPKIGDTLANFQLPSTRGTFDLERARADGPLVLVFYRGDW